MKRPAVFFDRDNTLIVNDGYLGNPADVVLIDGAADAIARVRALGYAAVVFSNQSGVARGMFTEDSVRAVNARMDELLLDQNPSAVIDRHEFCPFHPDGVVEAFKIESDLRKPRPGMIYQAAEKLALDLSRSWVVGDAPRDVEAGKAAGCRTILLHDRALQQSPAAMEPRVEPDHVVASLAEAGAMIEIATRTEPPAITAVEPEAQRSVANPAAGSTGSAIIAAERSDTMTAANESRPSNGDAPRDGPRSQMLLLAPNSQAAPQTSSQDMASGGRIEALLQQLIQETRRNHEQPHTDFAVSKLMAGIVQILALAALFLAYLRHDTPATEFPTLFYALIFQTLTISLLIMGRQR